MTSTGDLLRVTSHGDSSPGDSGHDSPRSPVMTSRDREVIMDTMAAPRVALSGRRASCEIPYTRQQATAPSLAASSHSSATTRHWNTLRTAICEPTVGAAAAPSNRGRYYDYLRKKRTLADHIAQSYDLDTDCDTMSYISRCLSRAPSVISVGSPVDYMWTLDNDRFYPQGGANYNPSHAPRRAKPDASGKRPKRKRKSRSRLPSSSLIIESFSRRCSSASIV